jgi:small subunit ribosomal protein S9
MVEKLNVVLTSGKRKTAIARANCRKGKGRIVINNLPIEFYQPKVSRTMIFEPVYLAGDLAKTVDIKVKVSGGGVQSQAEAARLAIARAFVDYSKDEKLKKTFLNYDRHLIVADTRRKEMYKPNDSKARKKRQKSYR